MTTYRQPLSTFVILLLLMTNLAVFFQFKKALNSTREQKNRQEILLHKIRADYELTNQAWALSGSIPIQKVPLKYLGPIPDSGALVLRISDEHCSSCVDQLIFEIRKHLGALGSKRLIVLYSSKKENQINSESRHRLLNQAPFRRIPDTMQVSALDSYRIPYLFAIDAQGQILSSFLPYPASEKYTGLYLSHIANLFQLNYEN